MSRSSPLPSSIGEKRPPNDPRAARGSNNASSPGRKLRIKIAAFARWAHIYFSMFGLAIVLFFSVTGLTLNHPDWFFGDLARSSQDEGDLDVRWLHLDVPASASDDTDGETQQIAKLEVIEHLRKTHGIRAALSDLQADEAECTISFKGPGTSADVFIDRESGHYTLTQSYQGFIAVINDLHKGRDTGAVWSVVIDLSAVLLIVISLSGLILLLYIKRRRIPGLITGLVGGALVLALYWIWTS